MAEAMELSDTCRSEQLPWSIIATSGPNSTLATVLAGFMMSVMAILLGREGPGELRDAKIAHTLALFGSGVLILGLDAFLFGNINALAGPKGGCAIAWTEAMPATSMLMVGSCLMVAGLAWVLAQYFVSRGIWSAGSDGKLDAPTKWKLRLPGILTGAVIVTTAPLVVLTVLMYINFMNLYFDHDISLLSFRIALLTILGAYVIAISCIITHKTRLLIRYVEEKMSERAERARQPLEDEEPLKLNSDLPALAWTLISAVVLAVVGALFAGLVGEHGPFVHANKAPGECWIYVGVALAVVPIAIPIAIALAVPSAPESWTPTRQGPLQATAGKLRAGTQQRP
ncbi:hypothetical protein [Mycobacterium sp. 852002-50816_SCH5313054-b]|uniref:hypothetical protein n=1 Tax=Mycobacterium sp. 852002-50816_SCH5313054-b TaxID=1834092 RepID=UPI0012EA6682|nr:hypothetical protein [Mycobacterium sp. 852002-50816_SCH5313054-b]